MNEVTGDDGNAEAGDGRSPRQRRGVRERGDVAEGGEPCHASRRCDLGKDAAVKLEPVMVGGIVNMKGVTDNDGDVRSGDGRSGARGAQAEGRTGPKGWGGPRRRVA